jgi:hypothetical protein
VHVTVTSALGTSSASSVDQYTYSNPPSVTADVSVFSGQALQALQFMWTVTALGLCLCIGLLGVLVGHFFKL